jgi:hypothetical protein
VLKQVKMLGARSKMRLLLYSPARRNWQTHRGENFNSMLHSLVTRMSGRRSDMVNHGRNFVVHIP